MVGSKISASRVEFSFYKRGVVEGATLRKAGKIKTRQTRNECSWFQDFKLPYGITFRPPPTAFLDPHAFYEKLYRIGQELEPNMWKYYFTLDKVMHNTTRYEPKPQSCSVGGVSCVYRLPGIFLSC